MEKEELIVQIGAIIDDLDTMAYLLKGELKEPERTISEVILMYEEDIDHLKTKLFILKEDYGEDLIYK